jgi:hypothetical protein
MWPQWDDLCAVVHATGSAEFHEIVGEAQRLKGGVKARFGAPHGFVQLDQLTPIFLAE